MPTLHGGNLAAYTRLGFRDFYAFFGIFIYYFLLLTRRPPTTALPYNILYTLFSGVRSPAGRSYVCRYAIKPTGPIKTQLNFFLLSNFSPLARSVFTIGNLCDRFLLIFRIRKTVFLIRVLVTAVVAAAGACVCVKRRRDYRAPNRLIYCIRFRERHCKRFLWTFIQYNIY